MASKPSEKERVYGELADCRRRIFHLRKELRHLRRATAAEENAALRAEAQQYRKALSNIAYRLDNGGVDDETLRSIVQLALTLKALKKRQRRAIDEAHTAEAQSSS